MLKFLIVIVLLGIIVSLFSGFVFLMKDDGSKYRVINSLMVRVGLSVILAVLIGVGIMTGQLELNAVTIAS
ncbi:MAG: twin transmembrane helix small protein [Halomonadaceae bacterium]|nr:MAG: twin transmembrane helix small protein [Halomonadaceae bacterium]